MGLSTSFVIIHISYSSKGLSGPDPTQEEDHHRNEILFLPSFVVTNVFFFDLYSRGAGGSSISPIFTFRATVSDTSPTFSLFDYDTVSMKRSQNIDYYAWATQALSRLFREQKASPSDVNNRGETLLHVRDYLVVDNVV